MSAAVPLAVRQNTPAWIDARRDAIGSSDLPILTGNGVYKESPYSLWCYKTRLLEADAPDAATQELWDLGHALEPVIADYYTARTGRSLRRAKRMLRHPDIEWATASLDRVLVGQRAIVEVKWVPHRSWAGPEPVPPYVQDQVQWQMFVTGWDMAHVAVLLGGKFEWHEVPADRSYQDDLLYIARDFRGHIEREEAPPVDGSEATRRALVRRYPADDGSALEPTAELHALMTQWRRAERQAKEAQAEADAAENGVRSIVESHAEAESVGYVTSETGSWRLTYRKGAPWTRVDHKAAKEDYRRALAGLGWDEGRLDAIESLHSEAKDGNRTLRKTWRGEEAQWT